MGRFACPNVRPGSTTVARNGRSARNRHFRLPVRTPVVRSSQQEAQTGHTEDMRVLLAILAVLVILILVLGIILDTVRFLFSVAMALIILAVVVLLLRQLIKR